MMLALGDITERCLRFFGITKERVQAVNGKKDCGCAKRQAAMNRWGYVWQYRLAIPFYWLRDQWYQARYGPFAVRVWMAGRYMGMAFRVLFYGR
jgi:hypothetical protein